MRRACTEAAVHGNELLPPDANNRRVVVILNPTANKRSAESAFDKYCAPVLHLAGIRVDVVKTESEGFARSYVESQMDEFPDAILVAGGDGTLMEVVTGVLRRDPTATCPVGVLPVGRTNSIARRMFFQESGAVATVDGLTRAALAVVCGHLAKKDVMQIEVLPAPDAAAAAIGLEGGAEAKKPIYAVASIKWGAFRDALALRDKYWYYGGLRERAAILFNAFRSRTLNRDCRAALTTSPPCDGCSNCFGDRTATKAEYKSKNWWSFLLPSTREKDAGAQFKVAGQDVRGRINPECGTQTQLVLTDTNELYLTTANVESDPVAGEAPRMHLRTGSANVPTVDWIRDSWRRTSVEQHLGSELLGDAAPCRTLELIPQEKTRADGREEFYSIDNEDFEVKPIKVTLLPARLTMFTAS